MQGKISSNLFSRSAGSLSVAFHRAFRSPRSGIPNRVFPKHPSALLKLAVFIAFLLLLMVFVDGAFMDWMNSKLRGPDRIEGNWYVRIFFFRITGIGNGTWVLLLTAVAGLILSVSKWDLLERPKRLKRISHYADLNFVFFSVLLSGLLVYLLKNIIGRARPKLQSELGAVAFEPGSFEYAYASFPSGHSTTLGALCMAVALLFPAMRWPLLFVALLGGLSRVVVFSHYPSDVIAGLAFGAGFVILAARWLAQRGVMFRFQGRAIPKRHRPV